MPACCNLGVGPFNSRNLRQHLPGFQAPPRRQAMFPAPVSGKRRQQAARFPARWHANHAPAARPQAAARLAPPPARARRSSKGREERGALGPQMSMSSSPTSSPFAANANASCAENVLFPTPPFPDRTSIMCLNLDMRSSMRACSGSGPFGADAHAAWLGHPWQASAVPASPADVPGQSANINAGHEKNMELCITTLGTHAGARYLEVRERETVRALASSGTSVSIAEVISQAGVMARPFLRKRQASVQIRLSRNGDDTSDHQCGESNKRGLQL